MADNQIVNTATVIPLRPVESSTDSENKSGAPVTARADGAWV